MKRDFLLHAVSVLALASSTACSSTSSSPPAETAPEELVSRPEATPDVLRGERLLASGRVTEAQQVFRQAIADDPEDARAWLDLGLTHEAKGDPVSAEKAYRRATEIDPSFADASIRCPIFLYL